MDKYTIEQIAGLVVVITETMVSLKIFSNNDHLCIYYDSIKDSTGVDLLQFPDTLNGVIQELKKQGFILKKFKDKTGFRVGWSDNLPNNLWDMTK